MGVSTLDTVFLMVADLDHSTEWYRDRLGLQPGPRYGDWQVMDLDGEVVFALHGASTAVHPSDSIVIGFRVADLDTETEALSRAGCQPRDPAVTDTGVKRFRTFADPDGHLFQLVELNG